MSKGTSKNLILKPNLSVDIHNEFVLATKAKMSLKAEKLLRVAIAQIMRKDTELYTYQTDLTSLANFLSTSKPSLSRDLDRITTEVTSSQFQATIEDGMNTVKHKYPLFSRCSYDDGKLELKLNPDLQEYFLALDRNYTQYILGAVLNLSTPSAIRIYELLHEQARRKFTEKSQALAIRIDILKQVTNTEQYTVTNFRRKVLEKVIPEINEKTDIVVSYKPYTEASSKKIAGFEFTVVGKPQTKSNKPKTDVLYKDFSEEILSLSNILGEDIMLQEVQIISSTFETRGITDFNEKTVYLKNIVNKINYYLENGKKIENKFAYIVACVEKLEKTAQTEVTNSEEYDPNPMQESSINYDDLEEFGIFADMDK